MVPPTRCTFDLDMFIEQCACHHIFSAEISELFYLGKGGQDAHGHGWQTLATRNIDRGDEQASAP
jgi:hypothetical protein